MLENYQHYKSIFEKIYAAKGEKNNFLLSSIINLSVKKRHEVHIELKKLSFDVKTRVITTKVERKYKLHVRKKTWFIPVVAAGGIYANISSRDYKAITETNNGTEETKVKEISSQLSPLLTTLQLNFYPNVNFKTIPFLQVGLSPTKEFPIINLGVGITFDSKINLSVGAAFQIQQNLNQLKVGEVIENSERLTDDLKYGIDPKGDFYIGLSYFLGK